MATWAELHARHVEEDSRKTDIRSKAGFKRLIANHPDKVHVRTVSPFNDPIETTADKLRETDIYTIVGPNPYTARTWYAQLHVGPNGKLTVK
jgi:hypothetical protein